MLKNQPSGHRLFIAVGQNYTVDPNQNWQGVRLWLGFEIRHDYIQVGALEFIFWLRRKFIRRRYA
jgi:hypothetical protein